MKRYERHHHGELQLSALDDAKVRLRAKLIEAIGYREPTPEERAAFKAISQASTIEDAEAALEAIIRSDWKPEVPE
jgi:hypothetical protein